MDGLEAGANALAAFVMEHYLLLSVIVLYGISAVIAYFVTDRYWGRQAADKVAITYGIGIVAVIWSVYKVWSVITYPGRVRSKRLFVETFGFEPQYVDYNTHEARQRRVKSRLTYLATRMHDLFEQENRLNAQDNIEGVERLRPEKEYAKNQFWKAHKLASEQGFTTYGSYRDYLTNSIFV